VYAAGFRAAGAAQRLGVFDALADGPLTAQELAKRIDGDDQALTLLLDVLHVFSYVDKRVEPGQEPRYANSEQATRYLLSSTPDSYATVFSFWHTILMQFWDNLEESVRVGGPAASFYPWLEARPATLREFQAMLTRLSRMLASAVVELLPVPDRPTRLFDVGGGHASYSIALCQRHPQLQATVVDLAGALATGVEAVAAAGLADRITGIAWDFTSPIAEVPAPPYDIVLLFNIVHGLGPDQNAALLRRLAAAMPTGALLAVLEPLDEPPSSGSVTADAFVKIFSLNLFHGQGDRAVAYDALGEWLGAAGFGDIRRHALHPSTNDNLVLATRHDAVPGDALSRDGCPATAVQ
jgi:DNA-binding transcriptional ArsR family regulator